MWHGWHLLGLIVGFIWCVVAVWRLVVHFRGKRKNDEKGQDILGNATANNSDSGADSACRRKS